MIRDFFRMLNEAMGVKGLVPSAAPPPPIDKMQLGTHAKRLLDDPVMRLAFERMAADLTTTWLNTAAEEREKREDAYRMLRALDGLERKLRAFTGNATLIAAEQRRKEASVAVEARR
jgi:hypothetical protein